MASADGAVARFRKVLECSICLELYIEPKMLHCSHEFCKLCLEDIVTFRNNGTASITCPLRCETKTVLSNQETVSDLAASYTTKNILDTLKTEDVARDSPDNDHPECWVKNNCQKPVSMSCCNQVMCKYCYDSHSQSTPVNYLNADEVLHHRKFTLIYHPRDHKLGVLCEEHSSICTHFCVDSTFLCMYCLHREHKTHKKNDIQTEARLLQEAVNNEIAALEAAEHSRTLHVKVATRQVKQILDGYRKQRSSTGKPLLPLEEARLLDEIEEHGKGYINERHKSFMVYNHFYSTSLSYFQTMELKTDVDLVMRREEILKNIQYARAGKQHVTLKLSGLDSCRTLGRIDVDIKENTSECMFRVVPVSSHMGPNVPDEAAALQSKHRGNDCFKQRKYKEAINCYTKAIDICPCTSTKELSIFYQNRAAANVQLTEWAEVVEDCTMAVQLDSSNYKALFSRAKAYEALGDKRKAYQNFAHGIVLNELSGMVPAARHIESRDSVLASLCEELQDEHLRKRTPAMLCEYEFRYHFRKFNYNVFDIPLTSDVSDSNYAKIMLNMKEAKYEMAMKLCDKEILSRGKHRDRAFLLRGVSKLLLSDDVGAMKDFQEVSELPPNSRNRLLRLDALLNISVIQGDNGDHEGCLESLERASRIDRHNATVYTMKGEFLSSKQEYEEAEVNHKLAMSLDPAYARARVYYCDMLTNGREYFSNEEAENGILETIQSFPDCSMIYTVYGVFLHFVGRDQEARVNFDKAIALEPHYAGPYLFKSGYVCKTDLEEAESTLLRLLEAKCDAGSQAVAYRLLGIYTLELREDAEASIKYFEKALDLLSPKDELLKILKVLEEAKACVIISKEVGRTVIL